MGNLADAIDAAQRSGNPDKLIAAAKGLPRRKTTDHKTDPFTNNDTEPISGGEDIHDLLAAHAAGKVSDDHMQMAMNAYAARSNDTSDNHP